MNEVRWRLESILNVSSNYERPRQDFDLFVKCWLRVLNWTLALIWHALEILTYLLSPCFQGYKVTKQGSSRMAFSWKSVTTQRRMSMAKEAGLGAQLAQLGLAASAAVSSPLSTFWAAANSQKMIYYTPQAINRTCSKTNYCHSQLDTNETLQVYKQDSVSCTLNSFSPCSTRNLAHLRQKHLSSAVCQQEMHCAAGHPSRRVGNPSRRVPKLLFQSVTTWAWDPYSGLQNTFSKPVLTQLRPGVVLVVAAPSYQER